MDAQSDLEVILEFLEEYYRQNSADNEDKVHHSEAGEERSAPVDEASYEQLWTYCDPPITKPTPEPFLARDAPPALGQNPAAAAPEGGSLPNCASARQTTKRPATAAGSGKKIRLFHFLFEMLEDPGMAHCVSWVPAAAGVFRFSSKNKDQVAVLWGQRKGNKRPMTYQKMSRALRNYARSGEIFKVKKKLTYQFSLDTLTSLQRCRRGKMCDEHKIVYRSDPLV
ncbi:transcription factor Spi-B [Pleuronectes platessa]|uniref:transcription factor Spi-B n=1 Tax=Pleuronectes platessa TaxID=8262 RepID=UPI00232A3F42|nr:transcription factor Spi-B [Pleuronectes platessa]